MAAQQISKMLGQINLSFTELALLGIVILVVTRIIEHLSVVWFSPLARLPGPKLQLYVPVLPTILPAIKGKTHERATEAHAKYGPIMRIGPTAISVADPELAQLVLKTLDLPKSRLYQLLKDKDDPDNLFMTLNR